MAFQNVGTPTFYVSILQWLKALGEMDYYSSTFDPSGKDRLGLLDINPSSQATYTPQAQANGSNDVFQSWDIFSGTYNFNQIMPNNNNFFMALGHDFEDITKWGCRTVGLSNNTYIADGSYLNYENDHNCEYNGFSIGRGYDADSVTNNKIGIYFATYDDNREYKLGSFLYGTYYEMPNAPNLSLTMSREYGSTKEVTTLAGGSISNTMWSSPPKWGNLGAWELSSNGNANQTFARTSRRTWDLKFSFMADSDLWGSNQMLSFIRDDTSDGTDGGDIDNNNNFNSNLLTNDNFFSQVWHKTLGGTLPFVFQPDGSSNKNPDQFAICRFKDNSLKATQSAFNVYDISLSIEEAW